jgi:hypothetical protein
MNKKRYFNEKHLLHRNLYEKLHGTIPKGHVVIFADGNSDNFDLGNLLLITKRELVTMALNNLFFDTKEKTLFGLAVAKHRIAINDAIKRRFKQRSGEAEVSKGCNRKCDIKCRCWYFSLRLKEPVCKKLKITIRELRGPRKSWVKNDLARTLKAARGAGGL